ncbi:MAG: hypothetical protein JSR66_20790 [Proteobacteria bacterium]|nr:hypothetical protein [Pseudomonadota bacterium]
MKKWAAQLTRTILCALLIGPTLLSAVRAADQAVPKALTPATRKPGLVQRQQLNPAVSLATLLPEAAEIDLGVVVVPDPRVARYQRPYDLGLVAIELGMLKNGYVLDRFYLPWYGDAPAEETDTAANTGPSESPKYGLMLFRCDAWRADDTSQQSRARPGECTTPSTDQTRRRSRFRALYIVPDVSTTGIDAHSFQCVVSRIASQLSPAPAGESPPDELKCPKPPAVHFTTHSQQLPAVGLLTFPGLYEAEFASALVVLGPSFSGSVDSLGALSERLDATQTRISRICAISSSTSDSSNFRANARYPNLQFTSLALENNRKLAHLARLVASLTQWAPAAVDTRRDLKQQVAHLKNRVAILAEASTFGSGVCLGDLQSADSDDRYRLFAEALCDSAVYLYFPANIADVRYGLLQARADDDANSPLNLKLHTPTDHLPLQLGTENGSEFPESRQSGLTSVSAELALERGLDALKDLAPVPQIVIVVATDVRDRLFLFDEVRARLPGALLIDLEADNLLAHPDFLHASRSALSFASAELTGRSRVYGCESTPDDQDAHSRWNPISSWSSDVQALLSDAVAGLASGSVAGNAPCLFDGSFEPRSRRATLQVVTLTGFHKVSTGYVTGSARHTRASITAAANIDSTRFEIIEASAPMLCLTAAWLWISPLVLPRRREVPIKPAHLSFADTFSLGICLLCAALLTLGGYYVNQFDPDNAIPFWLVIALLGGFVGLYFWIKALRRVRRAAQQFNSRSAVAPAALALSAVILACAPLLWLGSSHATYKDIVDIAELIELAVDPQSGMALFLVIGLATLALLHASIILSSGAGIVNRNSNVLRGAEELARPANKNGAGAKRHRRGLPALNPYGLLALASSVIALVVLRAIVYREVRLTLFGTFASHAALFAIVATSFSAALLACSAIGSARRVRSISRFFSMARAQTTPTTTLWPPGPQTPRIFATTPVVALAASGGEHARTLLESDQCDHWIRELKEWLYDCQDDSSHRIAAFTLLAVEISLYRWFVVGGVSCALASVATVWLFPIEADQLVILNLGLLVALGVSCGLVATSLERDEVLSSILCNRKARRRFSTPLFMFIALPFLAFALALAIANVPGVVDWGGGLLQLLAALGIHP